jgi:hypothetical protein
LELMHNVISKIKQNSSDMNEIILTPCDAGYVQRCTGFMFSARDFGFQRHDPVKSRGLVRFSATRSGGFLLIRNCDNAGKNFVNGYYK